MAHVSDASWCQGILMTLDMLEGSCHGTRPMTTQALVAERVFKTTLSLCNHV